MIDYGIVGNEVQYLEVKLNQGNQHLLNQAIPYTEHRGQKLIQGVEA
jgi:hypothetical protein